MPRCQSFGISASPTSVADPSVAPWKYSASHTCNFEFSSNHSLKSKTGKVDINNIFYVSKCKISSPHVVGMKILELFYILFLTPSLCGVCFILTAHFHLDTKYSSGILDLYLDFIKFMVEKVGL